MDAMTQCSRMPNHSMEETLNKVLTRRTALKLGLGAGALAASGRMVMAQQTPLRVAWFGTASRAERTYPVLDIYAGQHPEIALQPESTAWADYWPLLATQAAGGNAPDIIAMNPSYYGEYARRGILLPLEPYIGSILNASGFPESALDLGRIDGKLYGMPAGQATNALIYSVTKFADAGLEPPNATTTWEEFAELGAELHRINPKVYGSAEAASEQLAFNVWLVQQGKAQYKENGELGYDVADITAWLAMWEAMRQSGACVPAEIAALDQDNTETNALTTGYAACSFSQANLLLGYQQLNQDELALTFYPKANDGNPVSGHVATISTLWSIYAESAHKDEAVQMVDFLVNEPEVARYFGVDRGVPIPDDVRPAAAVDETNRKIVEFVGDAAAAGFAVSPPAPNGAGEAALLLGQYNEEVAFGRMDPEAAGAALYQDVLDALDRAAT